MRARHGSAAPQLGFGAPLPRTERERKTDSRGDHSNRVGVLCTRGEGQQLTRLRAQGGVVRLVVEREGASTEIVSPGGEVEQRTHVVVSHIVLVDMRAPVRLVWLKAPARAAHRLWSWGELSRISSAPR